MYRIGIDAGSKTVKVVLLDGEGDVAYAIYRRHKSDIASTLAAVLDEVIWRFGDVGGSVAFTGSAGIGIADATGIPFIQEVIATTRSVQMLYPHADAVIELGGEDAKIIYLTGGLEQRMNATCAGGTGGFIDSIAFMLGVQAKDMSGLGMSAQHEHPIASRCAVFAQTDVRPLLNAGVRKADIAGSVLEAVVRQTLTGLACGRPVKGTVVFAGGPLEHIPDLVRRFRRALGLNSNTGIKPENAHLLTAMGAALFSASACEPSATSVYETSDSPACGCCEVAASTAFHADTPTQRSFKVLALSDLRDMVSRAHVESDLPRLEPLFSSVEEEAAFKERHGERRIPTVRLHDCEGDLFLGIDAGSTAVKLAAIDGAGRLAYSDYRQTRGDVLETTVKMLVDLHRALPRSVEGQPLCRFAHVTATGYGEMILRAGLGVDSGVVETLAHVTAARSIEPDLTFLLDIGGQDMKALWVRDGMVEEAVLNEACSSGCGSFLEGTAHALKVTLDEFGDLAASAQAPLDLGTKCTVFMTSRVRHAQKAGAPLCDITAGIAYSIVRNALFRIIGADGVSKMGGKVVVQGGAFESDAVLRAFELVSGVQVLRPDRARLMGAIGAALTARARVMRSGMGNCAGSNLLDYGELRAFSYRRSARRCGLCANNCMLSVASFTSGGSFVTGNRCSRPFQLSDSPSQKELTRGKPPNVVALKQGLLRGFAQCSHPGARGSIVIGVVTALHTYEKLPFWHTLLSTLGFSVLTPEAAGFTASADGGGMEATPSESVCYPAKISHAKVHALKEAGARWAFMPRYERGGRCSVACEYPLVIEAGCCRGEESDCEFGLISPVLHESTTAHLGLSEASFRELFDSLQAVCPDELLREELHEAVAVAQRAQESYAEKVLHGNERAVEWIRKHDTRGMLLVGRPYHVDPALCHSIDRLIQDLGMAVVSPLSLPSDDDGDGGSAAACNVASRMRALARAAFEEPLLSVAVLQSFGCGYDALSAARLREELGAAGPRPVVLKIDDMVDTTHVGIRLRTLVETVEMGPSDAPSARRETNEPASGSAASIDAQAAECALHADPRAFLGMSPDDVETARTHAKDTCFVAGMLMGRAIRLVGQVEGLEEISVPRVCRRCVLDMLPDVVSRACGRDVGVSWVYGGDELRELYAPPSAEGPTGRDGLRPKVGIVGAIPLCFDSYLNDGIVGFLESHGCSVVLPDPANLAVDDVRYLTQIESYFNAGVHDIVYLQSFGCLKCHVHARGSYRELQRRFPGIRISFIDFDAESSALNRENRLRLAVSQAMSSAAAR